MSGDDGAKRLAPPFRPLPPKVVPVEPSGSPLAALAILAGMVTVVLVLVAIWIGGGSTTSKVWSTTAVFGVLCAAATVAAWLDASPRRPR